MGMNRREFLGKLWPFGAAASALAFGTLPVTFNDRPTYGYVSASDPATSRFKVYLDGEDVSWQAYEADDREGFIGVYDARKEGNLVRLSYPLRQRRIYGQVRLVPGSD